MGWKDAPMLEDKPTRWQDAPIVGAGDTAPTEPVKIGKDAFPDALREVLRETDWGTRNIAGAGTALSNLSQGLKQFVGMEDQGKIQANRIIRDEAPVGAIAGDIALTAAPFGLAGKSIPAAAAVGAGYGLTLPVEANNWQDVAKGKAINGLVGFGTAGVGQWGANKLTSGLFSKKLSAIEQKVKDKALQVAESETASARSAAGNAAQNAYRQLEHLRELGANRALTPDEILTFQSLERELSEKALEKLMPAAALKQSTSEAYKEAMKTEAERAAEYAAAKLSSNEVKQQVMARLKRYGPAALGGAVGNLIFPGLGGAVGGAATGLVLRPAIRSMINLSKNPAVQHGLLSSANSSLKFAGPSLPVASILAGEGLLGR